MRARATTPPRHARNAVAATPTHKETSWRAYAVCAAATAARTGAASSEVIRAPTVTVVAHARGTRAIREELRCRYRLRTHIRHATMAMFYASISMAGVIMLRRESWIEELMAAGYGGGRRDTRWKGSEMFAESSSNI